MVKCKCPKREWNAYVGMDYSQLLNALCNLLIIEAMGQWNITKLWVIKFGTYFNVRVITKPRQKFYK